MEENLPTREELAPEHTTEAIEARLDERDGAGYTGDAVLGAIDGCVTTFAVVTGVLGGNLPPTVAVLLGFASLVADGFSMAASNYEGTRSELQRLEQLRRQEQVQIRVLPEGERAEIRAIFARKGFEGEILDRIVETITEDEDRWIETMLTEELGMALDCPDPRKAAAVTFGAFILAGLIPLTPLILPGLEESMRFGISITATMLTFVSIGVLKGHILDESPLRAGLSTLLTGGGAALLAYLLGHVLSSLVGS